MAEMEVKVIRKTLFTLSMLMGITLLAACSPAQTASTPVPNMPNPATVYCEQHGGKPEIVTAADGSQSGRCVFPDGSACDEWAYFRGECKPGDSLVTPESTLSPTTVSSSPTPTATPVIPTPAPAVKPTVLRVAYFGGGHVMLWTEGQGSRQLTDNTSTEVIRISDDGQVIAYMGYSLDGIYGIWSVNADGTNHRLLVGKDYAPNLPPAQWPQSFNFAPASHTLYFMTDQYDLQRVNADGGSPELVLGAGKGGYFNFSPDGQWLTIFHPRELVLAHPDGSAARTVYEWGPEVGVSTLGPEIVWAPDSAGFRTIELTGQEGDPDSTTVWYFPVDGDPVKEMSFSGPYGGSLSPDGRTVVYLNYRNVPIDVHIVTMDGQDSIYGSYSGVNTGFMGWAPDSKHFLLNLSKEDPRLEVPYLCAAGEQPIKLTDTDDANAVVWVDAERVLFDRRGMSLHLQRVGAPSILVDANASSTFDYAFVNP
jgi:putative hemolysin